MGAPQQQRKILRIGIIQGGRITEERLIRRGQTVTIGDGQKNTFVLHSAGLPNRFPIFVFKNNQYSLAFTRDMDGKLSMDGGVVMGFDSVREKSSKQRDGSFQFPLTEQIRGKVTIANTTILFQFVPPPPAPAKSAQRDFSGSILKQIDTTYWGIFAMSAILHASMMFYAMSLPRPPAMTLEEIPDRFAKFIVPARQVEPPEVPGSDEKAKTEEEEKPKEEEKPEEKEVNEAPDDGKAPPKPVDEAKRREKRKEELKQVGILRVLGSKFGKSGSAVGSIISGDVDTPGLESLMKANPVGLRTAGAGESGGLRGDVNDTKLDDVGDVGSTRLDKQVKTGKRVASKPKLEIGGQTEVDGAVDQGSVNAVIRRNLGGVKACYETALKLNPNIQGKIYIEFTIEGNGRVSGVRINSTGVPDRKMEDCIKGRVVHWRFQKSEEGDPSDISLPVVLTPSQS